MKIVWYFQPFQWNSHWRIIQRDGDNQAAIPWLGLLQLLLSSSSITSGLVTAAEVDWLHRWFDFMKAHNHAHVTLNLLWTESTF